MLEDSYRVDLVGCQHAAWHPEPVLFGTYEYLGVDEQHQEAQDWRSQSLSLGEIMYSVNFSMHYRKSTYQHC